MFLVHRSRSALHGAPRGADTSRRDASRLAIGLVLLVTAAGCSALRYPTAEDDQGAATTPGGAASGTPEPPVLLSTGLGVSDETLAALAAEAEAEREARIEAGDEVGPRTWYTLTRLAREQRQLGKFDETATLLEQAALQVAARPPESIQRRTVHGMRSRLALDLLALGRDDDANALADELFEEVEREPGVGGPATIELASQFSNHRSAVAERDGLEASVLPLMRIALSAAEHDNPNRERMGLAYEVAREAEHQGDLPLARRAIERALSDARILEAANGRQLAALELNRARIALAQDDLVVAERSAATSNRIYDELEATGPGRAVGEATMAHVVARRGDEERARAIARTAQARLDTDPPPANAVTRRVLGELARMERALGAQEAALAHYRAALDLPGAGANDPTDERLVETLTGELRALEAADDRGAAPRVEIEAEDAEAVPTLPGA